MRDYQDKSWPVPRDEKSRGPVRWLIDALCFIAPVVAFLLVIWWH